MENAACAGTYRARVRAANASILARGPAEGAGTFVKCSQNRELRTTELQTAPRSVSSKNLPRIFDQDKKSQYRPRKMSVDYLLHESSVGYAIFRTVLLPDTVGARLKEVQDSVQVC